MKEGQQEFIELAHVLGDLAVENPCRMSDDLFGSFAKSLRGVISGELRSSLSREEAARYLHVSTRTLKRMQDRGEMAKPQRDGHKELSFPMVNLVKMVRKKT